MQIKMINSEFLLIILISATCKLSIQSSVEMFWIETDHAQRIDVYDDTHRFEKIPMFCDMP